MEQWMFMHWIWSGVIAGALIWIALWFLRKAQ